MAIKRFCFLNSIRRIKSTSRAAGRFNGCHLNADHYTIGCRKVHRVGERSFYDQCSCPTIIAPTFDNPSSSSSSSTNCCGHSNFLTQKIKNPQSKHLDPMFLVLFHVVLTCQNHTFYG